MSIFLDYNVNVPGNEEVILSSWCDDDVVLAVALRNKQIHFFGDEGYTITDAYHSRKTGQVIHMEWQPKGKSLAIGWTDGGLTFWNLRNNSPSEVRSPHQSAILMLKWAPYGNRLITSDEQGLVVVWKIDPRGVVSQCTQYRRKGKINHIAFITSPAQREKHQRSNAMVQNICPSFLFGGEHGTLHFADDLGHITDVQPLNASILSILYFEEKRKIIIVTQNMLLTQLHIAENSCITAAMKVKLSVPSDAVLGSIIWAGDGLLAFSSGESLIRFIDVKKDENSILNLSSAGPGMSRTDRIIAIAFNPRLRILCAGTRDGHVIFWRYAGSVNATSLHGQWEHMATSKLLTAVHAIRWGPSTTMVSAEFESGCSILAQSTLHRSIINDVAIIQSAPKCISIEEHVQGSIKQTILDCSIRIKTLVHDGKSILVHNGLKAEIYEFENESANLVSEFESDYDPVGINSDSVFRFVDCDLEICNFKGNVKHTISFTEGEGDPELLDMRGKFMVVGTDQGYIKIFDMSRREPKLHKAPGKFGQISRAMRSIKCNADGSRVSILVDNVAGSLEIRSPASVLCVFNADDGSFAEYKFNNSKYPVSHYWDPQEPRILVCETFQDHCETPEVIDDSNKEEDNEVSNEERRTLNIRKTTAKADKEICTFFATSEHGIQPQDSFELEDKYRSLLGIQIPHLFFAAKTDDKDPENPAPMLRPKIMRDFVGLDKADAAMRSALIDFSFYITIGNMDEAYRSVKLIQNASVWENMAHMCVKTKRLDVAEVCLGNMGHARGAAAVKAAKEQPEKEVPIAMVAIQLGLLDDAARLYRECKRYDLLNQLYRSAGYWGKSLEIASENDRIHLKTTHFQYARHLEAIGDTNDAIKQYEASDMHYKEVPRMLFMKKKINELEEYVEDARDKRLYLWWAQFLESKQDYERAIYFYRRAKDVLSIVRVFCFMNELDSAVDLVNSTNSKVGAYHLARHFESSEDIQDAIHFYALAGCYHHAIRLSKEHELDSELVNYALRSKPYQMIDTANYFNEKGEYDKAVQLYQKGGQVSAALELCFKAELYDTLHAISDDLGSNSSPAVLSKCADFFLQNEQFAKAVDLLIKARRLPEALSLCAEHSVPISEEMAEEMTLPKSDNENYNNKRTDLLMKLAKACRQQGLYHLATKKYTQAGDKLKAMKCLLKSGDTEKVIFFAGVSRNKDIYILGANYLQTLDWHENPDILKSIISFYSKAKSFERLCTFYESFAQFEIDEHGDYEKAMYALREAVKYISKSKMDSKEDTIAALQERIQLLDQFVVAKGYRTTDPSEMIKEVHQLLDHPHVSTALRVGDAYALLIDYYYSEENMEQAYRLIQKMKDQKIVLKPYIPNDMLVAIHKRIGEPMPGSSPKSARQSDSDEIDEDFDEEIEEEEDSGQDYKQ